MTAPAATRRYTVDDLAEFPDDGKHRELVDGRIVEWGMPSFRHAFFMSTLSRIISSFVLEHRLGAVVSGDLIVRILRSDYDARGADLAFYARDRIPDDMDTAATPDVPDFVVELISPSDRAAEVQEKVKDWLRTDVKLLWYVNPRSGMTTVYQGGHAFFDCAAYRGPEAEDAVDTFAGKTAQYVFISTDFVYSPGIAGPFPIREDAPKETERPYGTGKLEALTGYRPRFRLEDAVAETVAWLEAPEGGR